MEGGDNTGSDACCPDQDVCWICLNSDGCLVQACKCPRRVHERCLARWQLHSAGKSEENSCRFCGSELRDWKEVMAAGLGTCKPVTPHVRIVFNGVAHRLKVRNGPDGAREFERQVRQLLHLPEGYEFDVTFHLKAPGTGEKLQLQGLSAYDAAVKCAALTAASKGGSCSRSRSACPGSGGGGPVSGGLEGGCPGGRSSSHGGGSDGGGDAGAAIPDSGGGAGGRARDGSSDGGSVGGDSGCLAGALATTTSAASSSSNNGSSSSSDGSSSAEASRDNTVASWVGVDGDPGEEGCTRAAQDALPRAPTAAAATAAALPPAVAGSRPCGRQEAQSPRWQSPGAQRAGLVGGGLAPSSPCAAARRLGGVRALFNTWFGRNGSRCGVQG